MLVIGHALSKYTIHRKGALDAKNQTAYHIYFYQPK